MESPILKQIEQQAELLSQAEVLDLVSRLVDIAKEKAPARQTDLSKYSGILKHGPDPLEFQRQIRAEWDDRAP
ncbi:MAG: hypothetical protein ACHQ50_03245 [Fimbriimonadales bacterium]